MKYSETEIKLEGYHALAKALGIVNAERFISLIQREPFDYTQWQKSLFKGKNVKEISHEAMHKK